MYKRVAAKIGLVTGIFVVTILVPFAVVAADSSASSKYKVTETKFNAGSTLNACSSNFCGQTTFGDIFSGTSSSTDYNVQFGPNPDNTPMIQVIVLGGQATNLGVLDTDHTAATTDILKVRDYSSKGYIVQVVGDPPSQGTHELNNLVLPSTSQPGTEQFGINLVANTSPKVGADPINVVHGRGGQGLPAVNYDNPNLFKYVNGDIVAQSDGGNSETEYTISMIVNVANSTPLGHYGGIFSVVVVPTY